MFNIRDKNFCTDSGANTLCNTVLFQGFGLYPFAVEPFCYNPNHDWRNAL